MAVMWEYILDDEAVARAAALLVLSVSEWLEVTNCDLKCKKGV